MSIVEIQKRIYQNKVDKGFNVTDINKEFCLLYGEIAEAYEAYRKKDEGLGSELADIAIYLLGISEILGIDLESEIERKLEVRESFIKENNLKDITHDDVIAEIQAISNIDSMQKEKILDMIDKLLENRSRIQSFDCKLYYESGIQDVIGILFREKSY